MSRRLFSVVLACTAAVSGVTANDMAVTVYNSNLGVVSETRRLEFENGIGQLAFRDVPSQIDAASVRFELVDSSRKVAILEQNYAYDLVSPEQLFARYVDHRIELLDKDGRLYSGDLMAYSGAAVTLMEESGQVKIISMDNIIETDFPLLPEGLITRPTLFWMYQSDYAGSLDCRVGYQTGGLTWEAEYVGLLDKPETGLNLSGWASINNTSGKTYQDARLKLIAGDIHRAAKKGGREFGSVEMMAAAAPPGFEEKAFFEYRMYTLPRRATLANKEIKQISLFDPASTAVEKIYLYRPDRDARNVWVKVEFANSSQAGLGMPLPAGRVRLFKADDDGSLILLGEDRLEHTPRDEEVSLTVGTAFDIKAEQKVVRQTRISKKVEEREFEIELRNHKSENVTVRVEKRLYGFWEVLEANLEYEQKDANTLVFQLPVAADGTALLKLAVRFTSR